jgi:hypothetical protein
LLCTALTIGKADPAQALMLLRANRGRCAAGGIDEVIMLRWFHAIMPKEERTYQGT